MPLYCQRCGRSLVERYVAGDGRPRLQCESCGFIHYMNPRVVTAAIVEHGGRVLLQRRAIEPGRGRWTFPGGFLEIGETPEAGAVRETREETGLEVELHGLAGVYARPGPGIVLVVYAAASASDVAFAADGESTEVRWCAPDEIPWDELAFDTTEVALRDWSARRRTQSADTATG